jgi:hypothetical protein
MFRISVCLLYKANAKDENDSLKLKGGKSKLFKDTMNYFLSKFTRIPIISLLNNYLVNISNPFSSPLLNSHDGNYKK